MALSGRDASIISGGYGHGVHRPGAGCDAGPRGDGAAAGLEENIAARAPVPRAKAVIWIFLCGGVSHLESFDPKPALNRFAGKSIDSTPYKDALNPDRLKDVVSANPDHGGRKILMGLNTGFKKYGQSGLEVGDWWRNVGSCADDIAVVRSLWTSDNDHGAQLQFHTGRHVREGAYPTIGSWVAYGLGTLNENLPEYVVLGEPTGDCCGGSWTHGAAYLGPEHAGVRLNPDGNEPLPFVAPGAGMSREEQIAEFSLMGRLNRLAGIDYPDDPALRARIKAYELAFGMQTAVPETLKLEDERPATQSLYGLDRDGDPSVRTAVPGGPPHGRARSAVRADLSRRRWGRRLGRTRRHPGQPRSAFEPGRLAYRWLAEGPQTARTARRDDRRLGHRVRPLAGAQADGRDHHPQGFCAWLAGGGIKGGVVHGATDEIGFHAVEDRHYVTDIHATVLHQLGLDPHRLEIPGRKRLEIDYGQPIRAIIA